MRITDRALNRATLARQLLLDRESLDTVQGVRRVVALQAQQPASPYIALWNRLTDFDPTTLDEALSARVLVRSTLMRITLHTVHADDYTPFREAMEPTLRGSRLHDRRFTTTGLTPTDADTLLPALLEHAARQPRSAAELKTWLEEYVSDRPDVHLETSAHRLLRQYAPLWHVPTGAPWSFLPDTRQSYVTATPRPTLTDPDTAATGLQTLILRYLEGFGPATAADMAQFALVHRPRTKAAVQALTEADKLVQLPAPDGKSVLYDLPDAPRPPSDVPAPPRLLPMWDSTLLAHADRSRFLPPEYRKYVTRVNGDVLPTVLVDGYVAGIWRPLAEGVEVTPFRPLPAPVWEALAAEAAALHTFLADRDPTPYRRYDHWWTKPLPDTAGTTRLLPGG
ncbi:winged helix DNA-binding domain-containing protein [Streptomyces ipomoeae]|uniref:winged helix DNA-binding domain-containing protein n=1 Tax=Streptomyces ipomoeae TaxID=103232 RepID=UPI001146249D|nr:winged helix DNA-binding domain-containing protein [Streptomyces ipomoeae]MDX2936916.1 winged helix DNA-binding domain-containing protein [Streptomyces ipomoeae]TQE15276.1 winged helix DNA-binding domain-containing protein [Streptomyces ipomoeae]